MRARRLLTSVFATLMLVDVGLVGISMIPATSTNQVERVAWVHAGDPMRIEETSSPIVIESWFLKRLWACAKCGAGYAIRQVIRKDGQWDWERRSCDACAGNKPAA